MEVYLELLREAGVSVSPEELDLASPTETQQPKRGFELYCEKCKEQKMVSDGWWVCMRCGRMDEEDIVFEGTHELPQNAFEFPRNSCGGGGAGGRSQQGVFRVYIRQPVGYKRQSHFQAHLCRFLANENINPSDDLLQELETNIPNPEHHDAFIRMHQFLKRRKLPQWYTHIHTLLRMIGGVSERLPGEIHESMLRDFKSLDYQLTLSNRQMSRHQSLSGYRVLLAVMMDHYGFEPHYRLPAMKSSARHDMLYGFYKDLLYHQETK